MKIIAITVGLMAVLYIFSIGIDVLMGFKLQYAIKNSFHPFMVMDPIEKFSLNFSILLMIIIPLAKFFRKRKKN